MTGALVVPRARPYSQAMASIRRLAPILPVRDLAVSLEHYRRLGFRTSQYEGGGYGFAVRDGVEIHLGVLADADLPRAVGSAYLFVDDADALARQWELADVVVSAPTDTDWGQHEGSHVDPDGNVLRFGSPMVHGHPH